MVEVACRQKDDLIQMLTEKEYHEFLGGMYSAPYVAIDTETTGQDVRDGSGYLMGLSIATAPDKAVYLPFRHRSGDNLPKEWLDPLRAALSSAKCAIFHNAKFDLVSLSTIGLNYSGKFYDTMLMAHMIDENLPSKALDALGQKFLGEGKDKSKDFTTFVNAVGWDSVPASIMDSYARQDALLTLRLFHRFYPEFKKQGFDGEIWDTRQKFVRLLVDMESTGIRIDTGICRSEAAAGRDRMAVVADELGFNPGSVKQLGNYLLNELNLPVVKKTPTAQPCFDKDAMKIYDSLLEDMGNPNASLLLEYRGWQKAVSACYDSYLALLSPDGRLRPNYKIHGTVTGRLSCEKPNLQQIPKVSEKPWNGSIKRAFIPREGYVLYEADYSQLELRLGASYAAERSLIEEFSNPDSDVFTRMATELGMSRGDTKTLVYTTQYGGGINRIKEVFKVDATRAEEIRTNYFNTYPGFRTITAYASKKAVANGYVKTWSGRRRHFKYPKNEAFKAFNSVIQGGAADIVERAMLRCADAGLRKNMLLQVHDSIVFELPENEVADWLPVIREKMEAVEPDFGVRFAVDIKQWGTT